MQKDFLKRLNRVIEEYSKKNKVKNEKRMMIKKSLEITFQKTPHKFFYPFDDNNPFKDILYISKKKVQIYKLFEEICAKNFNEINKEIIYEKYFIPFVKENNIMIDTESSEYIKNFFIYDFVLNLKKLSLKDKEKYDRMWNQYLLNSLTH